MPTFISHLDTCFSLCSCVNCCKCGKYSKMSTETEMEKLSLPNYCWLHVCQICCPDVIIVESDRFFQVFSILGLTCTDMPVSNTTQTDFLPLGAKTQEHLTWEQHSLSCHSKSSIKSSGVMGLVHKTVLCEKESASLLAWKNKLHSLSHGQLTFSLNHNETSWKQN